MNLLRLKEVLKKKGLSGKELASMVGVSENSVSFIVQGKTFPKPETLSKIAEVLDVDIRELFIPTKTDIDTKTEIEKAISLLNNVVAKM